MLKKELCFGVGKSMGGGNLHFVSAETTEHVNLFLNYSYDTSEYPPASQFLVEINGKPTDQVYYDLNVNDGDDVNIIAVSCKKFPRATFSKNSNNLLDIYEVKDILPVFYSISGNNRNFYVEYIFENCKSLKTISEDLFVNYYDADNFRGVFSGTAIDKIPNFIKNMEKLFNISDLFKNCSQITSIPSDLFLKATELLYADCLFEKCTGLTEIPNNLFSTCRNLYSVRQLFDDCINITSIPSDLFSNCSRLSTVYGCFSGTGITSIPSDLFSNNAELKNINSLFYKCHSLIEIPEKLFWNNNKITEFYDVFDGCDKLTEIPENIFQNLIDVTDIAGVFRFCNKLTSIPPKIFSKLTKLKSAVQVFQHSYVLEIPEELFATNNNLVNVSGCFSGTGITSIPENLFIHNVELQDLSYTFEGTYRLTSIPENLFINNSKILNFDYTFGYSDVKSIPGGLFRNCTKVTSFKGTFKSTHLDEIPYDLFSSCPAVTHFDNCFANNNSSFVDFYIIIPENLFEHNIELQSLKNTFGINQSSNKIINVPPDLFMYSPNITNMDEIFMNLDIPDSEFGILSENVTKANNFCKKNKPTVRRAIKIKADTITHDTFNSIAETYGITVIPY